ncbi:hypothetical protein [Paenibacillus sp. 1P07SE]|uniref:hypothetical protein n=1 Tax=Paenibacillus sp. 1P07SE TaxID=3132209 RepID=UPI0039A62071
MKQKWLVEFEEHLISKRGLKQSSKDNYMKYIKRFLDVADSVGAHIDARHLFEESNIATYYDVKSGPIASAVLTAFTEYLLSKKEINKQEHLIIKDRIIELKKPSENKNEIDVLSEKEIDFILGNKVNYRFINNPDRSDLEISIVGPAICSLALLGLEQKELMDLLISDLDVTYNHFRIRNPYKGNDELLADWITLDEITKSKITRYLEYRSKLNVESNRLLLFKGKPLDTDSINETFRIFQRIGNCDIFKNGGYISAQLLVRSKIIHALYKTNGTCLMDIFRVFGLNNAQVAFCIRLYLSKTKLT